MNTHEVLKLALEWAESHGEIVFAGGGMGAVTRMNAWAVAVKEALAQPEKGLFIDLIAQHEGLAEELAQPEQEPVAVVDVHEFYDNCANFSLLQKLPKGKHTLYTTPSKRPWAGLTDEEMFELSEFRNAHGYVPTSAKRLFARIEAKLKEKNT